MVAKDWGFADPLKFWELPKLSRAIMTMYTMSSANMQSFESENRS